MFPISNCNSNQQSQDPSYDVNLPILFKLFTKDINEQDEMKPSTYQREVSLSVHERLKQLRSISKYNEYFNASYGGDFFDCFDVDPSILIFQNWEINKQYVTTVTIRNKTKKVKFISMSLEESEIFLIASPKQVRKISGHNSLTYKVKFRPVHFINYKIKMTINSDGSFYNFEMIALSPRPIINFPDEIDFDKIMINFNSMKSIHLTNVGRGDGMAKIYSNCQDILVEPEYICMNANDILCVEIKFRPLVLGHVKERLTVIYSTGEKLFVNIRAFVLNGNIFLNEDELVIKETYLTFNELSSLVAYNKTEYPVNFRWHLSKKVEIDQVRGSSNIFGHDSKNDKTFEELNSASNDLYDDKSSDSIVQGVFSIMPMEGVLRKNDSFTFIVMFSPITVGKMESIFYLEVEGLQNRLSVNIIGIALGPTIQLNLSTLDISSIYVNEKYDYQIFAKNSSLIRGTIRLLPLNVFNNLMVVKVDFEEAVLNPSDILFINVSVITGVIGSFVVELRFEIIEAKNIIRCILKGTAIEPVIKVDDSCIDFGTIPIGVCFDKCFTIANHSSIDVRLKLEIPLDVVENAAIYDDFIRGSIIGLPMRANEFRLEPNDFIITGKSRAEIKVFLVANIARKFNGNIMISSELHLYEEKKLPVYFIAIAPEITCSPNSLILPYCFKGVEYERTILISNKENVQVSFWLMDYMDETNGVYCLGKQNEMGLIGPKDSGKYTLQLCVGSIGEHSFTILAFVLGNGIIPLCGVKIKGIGPVILVETMSLAWHNTDILNPHSKTFSMTNYSPILAEFIVSLEKDPKLWIISTYEGTIKPDETIQITVTPKPTDVGLVKDHLQIQVKESRTVNIKLEAIAIGTSIRFSPNIFPNIDFGTALRIADNNRKLLVSNIGSKAQVIVLSLHDTPNIKKIRAQGNSLGKYFQIQPYIFVLPEYSEMVVWVSLKSQSLGIREETIHCFTRLENKYQMTYLGSSTMRANFIDLNFSYDPSLLHFNIVSSIHQDPKPTSRPFIMYTNWNSPVKLIMNVPEPFGIFKDDRVLHEETFIISVDKPLKTNIYFDPMFVKDYKIQSYSIALTFLIVDYNCEKSYTISADVYFPSISLSCSSVNFECVELFHSGYKELIIKNTTPTPVSYKWYWASVIPMRLDRDSFRKSSMETITTPFKKNDLFEQTKNSLKILNDIDNHRFSTFKEFESKARQSGLDIHPLVKEVDSQEVDLNDDVRTSVDEECASFLEFSPFWSELEANNCLVTFINFTPRYYLFFEAVAVCVVKGGPREKLVIQGCCAPVNFEIIPTVIKFGFAPCCELCKSMFIIKNNSLKKLPYKVHAPKLPHINKKALHESSIWVEENSGVVKPYSSIQVKITAWFGIIGEIVINTLLEVNNKPKYFKIVAYCCPNQVLISLPRKFPQLIEEYLVLASLKEPWFFVPEFITKIEDGWENIIIPEMLPSTGDIYMGMERFLLHLSLYHHPSLFSEHCLSKKPTFKIKGFKVPGYFINFGVIIFGTKAEYRVKILNYYPREVVLRIICKDLSKLKGLLEFQDLRSIQILPPLGTTEFSVSIFATNMFEKSDINIRYAFDVELMCGPRIPISLSAVISLPRLILPDSVDFGAIKSNQMKIINIPIKNIGIIPCEWIAFVRDGKGHHHELDYPKSYNSIPFIVKKRHGYTEPNISDNIPIYFNPKKSGDYNMILEFAINMNPEKITIPIKGVGVKPLITISDIDFGCVIPFCKPVIKTLEIKNLSSFAVEVFFPAYDDEFMAEKLVFQAVKRYYKQNVYVLTANDEMTPYNKIYNIYRRICDEAIMLEKFSRLYNISEYYQIPSFVVRKSKSEMVFNKRYKLNLRRCESLSNLKKLETRCSSLLLSHCYTKSPELLLEEYLNYVENGCEPIPKYWTMKGGNIYCSEPEPFLSKKFTLIIVLGAPRTEHIEWAAKLAKVLGMVSVSLDEVIFQELGESDSIIAEETCTSIREMYIREIVKDDCFDEPSEYPGTTYLELRSMVEELMSKCPSKLYEFSTVSVKIDGIKYSQQLPFCLTPRSLRELIKNRISRYSTNVLIESVEGIFFTDVTIALSILIELFADITNFHIINLCSFPIYYLNLVRTAIESEAANNFKAIIEYLTSLHGIEHAEKIAEIPSFLRRYYYLFNVGDINEGSEDVLSKKMIKEHILSKHPKLIQEKHEQIEKYEETISEFESQISQTNSSPFIQMMQRLCDDIIHSKDPEIIWTRSFVSHLELHSYLEEFMKYARWFSSLVPLWSLVWYSKPSKSFKFDLDRKSTATKRYSRSSRTSKRSSRTSKRSSRTSKRSYRTSRSSNFDLDREFIVTKRLSKLSISSEKKIRKQSIHFDFDTGSRSTKRRSRSSKPSPKHASFFTKSAKVNDHHELPLWILCTEDLDFEKYIPLLCSQKKAFGIEPPEPPDPKEKTDLNPEPRVYFHLNSEKTIDHNLKLKHFKIYDEMNEADLLEIHENQKIIKKKFPEIFHDRSLDSYRSNEKKSFSQYNNLWFSQESQDFITRKQLEPGKKASWKVIYSPTCCGIVSNILSVRAAGFNDRFTAHIEGVCDIPAVAFEFSNLLHDISFGPVFSPYKSGFCIEEATYYFQPALISRLEKYETNIHTKEATFNVKNISSVPAKVFIDFDKKSEEFDVLPKDVEIKPNEAVIVTIFSSMSAVGSFKKEIFLSTENNPLPQTIKVYSKGLHPVIIFKPKKLVFERVLLYQENISVFQITNLCYKPIYWEIVSHDSLAPVIRCSKNSSILEPDMSEEIAVFFRPEECYDCKRLFIKIYDAENKRLLRYKVYTLHLYATDIEVKINTDLNTQNYLEFGDIKALKKYVSKVTLSKSDKTKVFYRARIATNEKKQGNVFDYITINSMSEGYIRKRKVNLKVEVFCNNEIHFEKVKAIFIEIYSPFDSNLQIAEIPLIFSFHSHFPKYALYPGYCLDFGNMEIDTEKKLFLTLENIGVIDFDYSITDLFFSQDSTSCSQDSLMVQESNLNEILLPPLKISKNTGNILPGRKEIYEVVCKPKTVEKIFYEMLLTISELPECPKTISICCAGIAPVLNFDIESLFREFNIVDSRQELSDFTNNGCFVAVFIKTECTLYFRNVSLCQTVNVDVFIENKSVLSCNVSVIVDGEEFSIQPPTLYIKPYLTEIVTLTYSPQLLGVHKGTVKIKLDLPYTIENSSFIFLVEGSSVLPAIHIYDYFSETIIKNHPIRIGFTANTTPVRHLLKIKNSGSIFSQTIIDIESAINATVSLGLVSIQNRIGPDSGCGTKSVRLYLHPKETAVMGCTLTPQRIGLYSVTLVAYTVLNPYETQKVIITGDAIIVNILLDGLTLTKFFQDHRSKESHFPAFIAKYNMNFGLCESGMVKKIIFYISNQSKYSWAFKFSRFKFVSFSPAIGYVRPHSRVKIESILCTDKQFPPVKRGTLFLTKMRIFDDLSFSQPSISWKIQSYEKVHRIRSDVTVRTVCSSATSRSARSNETVYDVGTKRITIRKIDKKIILLAKCWPVEDSLHLYRDDQSKFRSTVVKQCSEEILFLENICEASCHVIFQLENISFEEIDCKSEFLERIGFVKMPSHAVLSGDPADELPFFHMNDVFPDVCLNDVFCPLFVQEMLLPKSTIKAKFTFCPPKPGIFSANVRIIMDDTLLDFPQTQLSAIGYVPPIQIAFKNEFALEGVPSSVKCIKITAYEPKSFVRNKLIYVYNATDCAFLYNWYNKHNVSSIENSSTGFYCHQVSGYIEKQSVLKLEMIFNPQDYGVYKSHWHLEIPDYNTEQAFLFIGETKIPDIIFEPDILAMNPIFLDMKVVNKIKIYNKEKVPFKYNVDAISLYSDIESEKLFIDPASGILKPNMTHEVKISSTPHVQRKYVYKTFWDFENVARRRCFKVITECLNIELDVCCSIERNNTNETILLKENESNFISIGKVSVNDVLDLVFIISNKGKVAISYEWVFSENETNKLDIEINPYDKIVPAFTEFSTFMKVTVLEKFNFRNIPFVLKVFKGPVYTVFLCGSSEDPLYRLSFKEYDFGARLIQTNDNVYNSVSLQFENLDEQMLQIKVKSPVVGHFKIQLTCSNVPPKSGIDIPIHFFPRDKRKYNETIEFFINDTLSEVIVLLGEGELLQVDVVKPLKGIIAFDPIGVNELILKETQIINTSKIIININLKIKNDYKELIKIKLDPTDMELRPNLLLKISVYLRCSSFGDYSGIEVWAMCRDYEVRLFSLTIHCVGAKLSFDRETVNFFPHFRKQLHREEVAIINSGNIPTRFKLDTTDLPKIFKIEPLQGECLPGIPYILNILCCLKFITNYLSTKVKCIEDGKNEYLELTLVTYPFPPGIELQTLKFLCPVRQQNTQSISVRNGTKKTLSLLPLITGHYFSGEASFEVAPKSTKAYSVFYKPLTMTKDDQTHKGILVIPTQPEEIVVKLEGRSTEPLLEGKLSLIVIAREECVIKLIVENPLETLQKMSVRFKKSPSNKDIFNIEGNKCIVLPSSVKKEYIIKFYAYKEGTVNFDVIFTNDETFEYMFYNVKVVIHPPAESWETVEINTMVDHSINKTISIYNPLETKCTFRISSLVPNIDQFLTLEPPVLDVHPKQHGKFSIIYSPKELERREVELKVTSNLLGTYFYRTILSSGPPLSSNIISMSIPLGSKHNFDLKLPKPVIKQVPSPFKNEFVKKRIIHRHKVATYCNTVKVSVIIQTQYIHRHRKLVKKVLIFKAKSDSPEVTIKPLGDSLHMKEILCVYEPTSVGTSRALVTVEYFKPHHLFAYRIVCQCEPPRPQGPFEISVFEPFVLEFKNVFNSKQTYSCSCVYDCCLKISKPTFTLEAKEVKKIEISARNDDFEYSTMIRITDLPENLYNWDYYFNVHR